MWRGESKVDKLPDGGDAWLKEAERQVEVDRPSYVDAKSDTSIVLKVRVAYHCGLYE